MPCYADHANAIVTFSGNRAGYMRAMAIIIERIIGIIEKIPAVKIIDETISVIVNKVSGNFIGVGPDIVCQVRMVIVNACIYHGYYHPIALRGVPRCWS